MEAIGINIGYLILQLALFGLFILILVGGVILYRRRRNQSNKTDM